MTRDRAYKLRGVISMAAQSIPDETAVECPLLFPKWEAGKSYEAGFKLEHDGQLYTVLQLHTSQTDWEPPVTPSLFAPVLPGQSGTDIGDWVQPDSTNPYMLGERVRFEGHVYESTIDGNIWSPRDYPTGWQLIE